MNITCTNLVSALSSNTDEASISASCPISTYPLLTSCSVWTPLKYTDGSYPGLIRPIYIQNHNTNFPANNSCTAANGSGGKGVKASAICCDSTYNIECVRRYGDRNSDSTVQCENGYFMTGCSGYSPHINTKLIK